ncbi:MAG: hypothetical protein MHM6MM_000903 [Cercozoa sp. M6MM]
MSDWLPRFDFSTVEEFRDEPDLSDVVTCAVEQEVPDILNIAPVDEEDLWNSSVYNVLDTQQTDEAEFSTSPENKPEESIHQALPCSKGLETEEQSRATTESQRPSKKAEKATFGRCFRCFKTGHDPFLCPGLSLVEPGANTSQSSKPSSVCYRCNKPGHFARECTASKPPPLIKKDSASNLKCYLCDASGHIASNCQRFRSKDVCFRCKKPGHRVSECPQPRTCHACGQPGHFASQCAKRRRLR